MISFFNTKIYLIFAFYNVSKKLENQIEHEGTVISMNGNMMIVRIVASSACSGCTAKNYCGTAESKDKDIFIEGFSGDFVSGERVKVVMQSSMGFRALSIGYIIPFALALITLLIVFQFTGNELASGLSALLILVPYYLILHLFNRKISKTFGFTVQKINIA